MANRKQRLIMGVMALTSLFGAMSETLEGAMAMEHSKGERNIVLIGASYAGGWNPGRPVGGYQIINKGVTGQQSFEMLARFETDVIAQKPYAVIIWGLINDIFRGNREKIEETLAHTRESFTTMVDSAEKSGIVPILATEITVREREEWKERVAALVGKMMGKESYQDYVNQHVRKMNQWIREKAAKEGILLLDIHLALSDSRGERVKEYSNPDGSHISQQGYDVLTQFVEERLKQAPPINRVMNPSAVPDR